MATMNDLVPRYEEVERCDSWGTARIKQKALEETYGKVMFLYLKTFLPVRSSRYFADHMS